MSEYQIKYSYINEPMTMFVKAPNAEKAIRIMKARNILAVFKSIRKL